MVRSEGDMSLKNPVTPPGIDPGTVRLVVQRLNHYATPGPYEEGSKAETTVEYLARNAEGPTENGRQIGSLKAAS